MLVNSTGATGLWSTSAVAISRRIDSEPEDSLNFSGIHGWMVLKSLDISLTEWKKGRKSTTASWRGSAEEGWRHVVISVYTCAGKRYCK